ncbi:hypothetical protein HELRODRAFT_106256 [Helobdella robusta]|uniref:Transmembrane protein 260 n=1 Tax=Helobdella robusta TaxID=6412 RepID=T1EE11_HELRO|nr:hypothetical protein HELRODRAFT_106256 [Helobdella robusta]ESO06663.1 hypothetical protein HELRODRAFT_106256 [Helobdella robusta]
MSAVFSSFSSFLLQLTVLRTTKCIGTSLLVLPIFSLNNLTWFWSTCAEVFALNNFFTSLIVFTVVVLIDGGASEFDSKLFRILAFICGLSLTNQHTIVIYVLFVASWALFKLHRAQLLTRRTLATLTFITILSLSPYVYLPISSHMQWGKWSWGDQRSLAGFFTHLFRVEYGTFDLGKGGIGSGFQTAIRMYFHHLQSRMCELCPWLALIGLVTSVSWYLIDKCKSLILVCLMTTTYLGFFCVRANLDLNNALLLGVVERFWMQSDIGLVLLACVGYHTAIRLVVEKFLGTSKVPMTSVFTTMGSIILIALQLQNNYSKCNNSNNFVVHNFATGLLRSMPRGALILTKGDLPSLSLRYFHICEGVRPDIDIIDVEILSYQWSIRGIKKFNPSVVIPGDVWNLNNSLLEDGRHAFNFKTFLDVNIKRRPIFACIGMQDRDPSWTPHYKIWPYGVCHSIQHVTNPLNPKLWAETAGGLADKWRYKYNEFDKRTWEKVANDEMWHAKIATAFHFYKEGVQSNNDNYKADLLYYSYELYFRAIKLHQHPSRMTDVETFPSFWHKNFALVCEKLLHVTKPLGLDKIKLCKSSIFHFEQYLHLSHDDADANNIISAIQILKQRLDVFNNFKKADETLERAARNLEKLDGIAEKMRNFTRTTR